jgi:hypothetical protein
MKNLMKIRREKSWKFLYYFLVRFRNLPSVHDLCVRKRGMQLRRATNRPAKTQPKAVDPVVEFDAQHVLALLARKANGVAMPLADVAKTRRCHRNEL